MLARIRTHATRPNRGVVHAPTCSSWGAHRRNGAGLGDAAAARARGPAHRGPSPAPVAPAPPAARPVRPPLSARRPRCHAFWRRRSRGTGGAKGLDLADGPGAPTRRRAARHRRSASREPPAVRGGRQRAVGHSRRASGCGGTLGHAPARRSPPAVAKAPPDEGITRLATPHRRVSGPAPVLSVHGAPAGGGGHDVAARLASPPTGGSPMSRWTSPRGHPDLDTRRRRRSPPLEVRARPARQ